MKLLFVSIKNFRNVVDSSFAVENNVVIERPNKKGKTNTLNAIHWAFTGVTMDGAADNRANFTDGLANPIEVELRFDNFTFARRCEMKDGTPTVTVIVNGEECDTTKAGEAVLHQKLGLTDLILTKPTGFDVLRFLLNPLYFDTLNAKTMRTFMFKMANINLESIAAEQKKPILKTIEKYGSYDPYKLGDSIAKDKKKANENIKFCKNAPQYFPTIKETALALQKKYEKELALIKADEANIEKYALSVSGLVNDYYKEVLGIEVCLLEKGVGDDVFKDVCYPLSNGVPFYLCSYAEKTLVAAKFVNQLVNTYKINPLPFLVDNMESLDSNTRSQFDKLGVRYIGAAVKEEE